MSATAASVAALAQCSLLSSVGRAVALSARHTGAARLRWRRGPETRLHTSAVVGIEEVPDSSSSTNHDRTEKRQGHEAASSIASSSSVTLSDPLPTSNDAEYVRADLRRTTSRGAEISSVAPMTTMTTKPTSTDRQRPRRRAKSDIYTLVRRTEKLYGRYLSPKSKIASEKQPLLYDTKLDVVRNALAQCRSALSLHPRPPARVAAALRRQMAERAKLLYDALTSRDDGRPGQDEFEVQCMRVELTAFCEGCSAACEQLIALVQQHGTMIEARVRLFQGSRSNATSPLSQSASFDDHFRPVLNVIESILEVCRLQCTQGPADPKTVLESVLKHCSLTMVLRHASPHYHLMVYALVRFMRSPVEFAQTFLEDRSKEMVEPAAHENEWAESISFLILGCVSSGRLSEAYRLYVWMHRNGMRARQQVSRRLLRILAYEDETDMADVVQQTLMQNADASRTNVLDLQTYEILAWYNAKLGDSERMNKALEAIEEYHSSPKDDGPCAKGEQQRRAISRQLTLHRATQRRADFAHATRLLNASIRGDVDGCLDILRERFDVRGMMPALVPEGDEAQPADGEGVWAGAAPGPDQYRALVQALVHAGLMSEAEVVVERMADKSIPVPIEILNALLRAYVVRDDTASALTLFEEMKEQRIQLDEESLNTMIRMFARNKDVENANKILQVTREIGLRASRRLHNSLLHAHIQAGSWQGAMDLFTMLHDHRDARLRPGPSEYDAMLRMHVRRQMPVQDTYKFLRHMLSAGFSPSTYTFTTLLNSSWKANLGPLAEEMFTVAERRLGDMRGRPSEEGANAHHFGSMIRGYLRRRKHDIAREYLGEMTRRKNPVYGTLRGIIVSAYTRDTADEDDLEFAEGIAQRFAAESPKDVFHIYESLLRRASATPDVAAVDRLLRDIAKHDVETPLRAWDYLLDALRRDGNSEGALQVWNLMFAKALDQERRKSASLVGLKESQAGSKSDSAEPATKADNRDAKVVVTGSRRSLLCAPLRRIMDALISAGRHDEVAMIWIKCREHGFAFDSHNWNQLTVAMLQAGRIEDACNIIDRVLNEDPPYKWHSKGLADLYLNSRGKMDTSAMRVTRDGMDYDVEDGETDAKSGSEVVSADERRGAAQKKLPPFVGPAEALFGDELLDRTHGTKVAYVGLKHDRNTQVPPQLLPDDVEGGSDGRKPTKPRVSDQKNFTQPENNIREMLYPLQVRQWFDRRFPPWFVHFRTLNMLYGILQDARRRGGRLLIRPRTLDEDLATEDKNEDAQLYRFSTAEAQAAEEERASKNISTVDELMRRHPRVAELLLIFERRLEQKRAR